MQSREKKLEYIDNNISFSSDLVYFNCVGLVFNDRFFLNFHHSKTPFFIENVKRLKLVKKRVLIGNLSLFCLAATFILVVIFNNKFFPHKSLLWSLVLLGCVFIFLSVFFKKYRYSLYINHNNNPIEVRLDEKYKEDAKYFIKVIAKKLKSDVKNTKHLTIT